MKGLLLGEYHRSLLKQGQNSHLLTLGDALKKRVIPLAEKLNSKITFSCDVEKKKKL